MTRQLPGNRLFAAALAAAWMAWSAASASAAGLLAPTDLSLPPLRVTEHTVSAAIHDQVALTTVNQTFHNDTSRRLEATYVFPLPDNADLTNFQMSFNGTMVEGQVLPADQAARTYESIVRQMKDPGLIEFIGRRLLQMKVFPIEPGSDTKIQVKYQQICKPLGGMNAYHYPLRTAKSAGQVYGTVRFEVKLDTTAALKNVWSPTHSIEVVRDGEHIAKAAYEASKGSLDDDFVLLYDTNDSDLGLAVVAYKPSEKQPGHFVLTLAPKQLWPQQDYQPQDVVFVIDTSGSMAGDKIDQAKAALKFCIDKLDDRDRFSVIRFSTGFDTTFEELAAASKQNRAKAKEKVALFTAAGGTNIMDSLRHALDLRPRIVVPAKDDVAVKDETQAKPAFDARPFVIVFITDGRGNQPGSEVLGMVKANPAADGARIFSFGVGHDVDTVLLDQLANAHSGRPTYVQPGENLELVLGDFFSVISQPVLTNLKLTLPEIGATEKFPASLGDLYHGQQMIVVGKFDASVTGPVKLTAMRSGKMIEYTWPSIAFANTQEATYVPSIWAGRKIAYLLDQIRANGESQEMVQEVIALSQTYGIQTPYSSWFINPQGQPVAARGAPGVLSSAGSAGGLRGDEMPPPGAMMRRAPSDGQVAGQAKAVGSAGAYVAGKPAASSPESAGNYGFDGRVTDSVGAAATDFAKKNTEMREARSKDGGRIDQSQALSRRFGSRWYNRIGQFWVDESVDEKTTLVIVRFGSDAYFEIVRRRPDLRPVLAASPAVVVKISDSKGFVVSTEEGKDTLSAEELEQIGPLPRSS